MPMPSNVKLELPSKFDGNPAKYRSYAFGCKHYCATYELTEA